MSLITGSPEGNVVSQEEIYLSSAPYIYFQNVDANPLNNPDANGFYWGLSGTTEQPAYNLGCVTEVSLAEGLTMNDVRCDTVGVKDTIQRRDYVDFKFTIQSLLPLSSSRHPLKLSAPTVETGVETIGIGTINNNLRYMLYAPIVYDEDAADWLMIHLHRGKFMDAWEISMNSGEAWAYGVTFRAYADTSKPAAQQFGVIRRQDASALT